jgi:DNA-binding winged helix-turn-helix (wHTH) protein
MRVFGDFEFDETSMLLHRGGNIVPINGQCLDLLALLLDHPGQLVMREEIRRALWPDSTVDFEHSVDVLVSRLRTALGDDNRSRRYIQTVPKKGYRFVKQVRSEPSADEPRTSVKRARIFVQYTLVAVLAAMLAMLIVHTRYDKFVPPVLRQNWIVQITLTFQ